MVADSYKLINCCLRELWVPTKLRKRYAKIGKHKIEPNVFRHLLRELWENLRGDHCIVIMTANTPGTTRHLVYNIIFK